MFCLSRFRMRGLFVVFASLGWFLPRWAGFWVVFASRFLGEDFFAVFGHHASVTLGK